MDGVAYDYFVSFSGEIKNKSGKILKWWLRGNRGGCYPCLGLCKDGERKKFSVHRIVAAMWIPNPENKTEVNHIDGNPMNFHGSNLEWSTRSENELHKIELRKWEFEELLNVIDSDDFDALGLV